MVPLWNEEIGVKDITVRHAEIQQLVLFCLVNNGIFLYNNCLMTLGHLGMERHGVAWRLLAATLLKSRMANVAPFNL